MTRHTLKGDGGQGEGQTTLRVCVFTRRRCPARGSRAGNNPAVQTEGRGPARLRWSVCHSGPSESPRPSHPTNTNTEVVRLTETNIGMRGVQTFALMIAVMQVE